jgi:hypothetical protein
MDAVCTAVRLTLERRLSTWSGRAVSVARFTGGKRRGAIDAEWRPSAPARSPFSFTDIEGSTHLLGGDVYVGTASVENVCSKNGRRRSEYAPL